MKTSPLIEVRHQCRHCSPESIYESKVASKAKRASQNKQSSHKHREEVRDNHCRTVKGLECSCDLISLVVRRQVFLQPSIEDTHSRRKEAEHLDHSKGAERLSQDRQDRSFLLSLLRSQRLDLFAQLGANKG